MARVVAYRIGIAILLLLAFWLLWSMAYEVVVAQRWAPTRFPSEGASRWALFRMQNADRSADFFLVAWRHFYDRLVFAPTRTEALIRGLYAAAAVVDAGPGWRALCVYQPPADALWRRSLRHGDGGRQAGPHRQAGASCSERSVGQRSAPTNPLISWSSGPRGRAKAPASSSRTATPGGDRRCSSIPSARISTRWPIIGKRWATRSSCSRQARMTPSL